MGTALVVFNPSAPSFIGHTGYPKATTPGSKQVTDQANPNPAASESPTAHLAQIIMQLFSIKARPGYGFGAGYTLRWK
jgi:hypothetical protein